MKKVLKSHAFRAVAAAVCALAAAFSGRVGTYAVLAALFKAWNVNAVTYAYAPVWAQRMADLSGEIADCAALTVGLIALLFLRKWLLRRDEKVSVQNALISCASGALLACALIGALFLIGSVRFPHIRAFNGSCALITLFREGLFAMFIACILRGTLTRAADDLKLPRAKIVCACVLSALGEVALFVIAFGTSVMAVVNAALIGVILYSVYKYSGSWISELMLTASFRMVSRVGFGYPDLGGAYPVSDMWLTGETAGGLEAGGVLLILMTALAAVLLLRRKACTFFKR